ncbi:MAG: peptidoglycan bridge formation glycyltransferase FemA/FemB family protein [Candidatus Kerfeldbacteria bacterium]|nr:peptidoglycan bridge formation glycyltransferase FemA/FemB family protein [Candidatus Kerfeldbacteria bacterium]
MSTVAVSRPTDPAAWDSFVRSATQPNEVLQSWVWGEFQQAAGRPILRLAVTKNGMMVAAALVVPHSTRLQKSFWLAPRGPVLDARLNDHEQRQVWQVLLDELDRVRRVDTMFLKVEPNVKPPADLGFVRGTGMHPEQTLLLDLTKSEEQLLAEMHPKTRYNIRLAERHGVTVNFGRSAAEVDTFLGLLHQTANRQGIGIFPDSYYRTMVTSLGQAIEVAVASHQNKPLASALVARFGTTASYLHGASASERHELMASHVMQWRIIQRVKQAGRTVYDFYGIAPADDLDHRWAGVTRFKKGFGGTIHVYPGAFNYIYQRRWFWAYRTAKKLVGR